MIGREVIFISDTMQDSDLLKLIDSVKEVSTNVQHFDMIVFHNKDEYETKEIDGHKILFAPDKFKCEGFNIDESKVYIIPTEDGASSPIKIIQEAKWQK